MSYAFIDSSSLTSIANEIRRKLQSTDTMTPAQMAINIASIDTSGDVDYLALLESNSLITYESSDILRIGRNLFDNATALTSISVPNCTLIDQYAFTGCTGLESIYAPLVATLSGGNIFYGCSSLEEAKFPLITTNLGSNCFSGCSSLITVDVGSAFRINSYAFADCTSLVNLIIRRTAKCDLQNVNAFSGCGTNINVYVPTALKSTYSSDSVWSAVTGATLTFVDLEGSVFE